MNVDCRRHLTSAARQPSQRYHMQNQEKVLGSPPEEAGPVVIEMAPIRQSRAFRFAVTDFARRKNSKLGTGERNALGRLLNAMRRISPASNLAQPYLGRASRAYTSFDERSLVHGLTGRFQAVEWAFVALSLSFVLMRLGIRIFYHRKKPNLSDYFVVVGWCFALADAVCDTRTYQLRSINYNNYRLSDEEWVYLYKVNYAASSTTYSFFLAVSFADFIVSDAAFFCAKFSLLALYYNLISIAFDKLRIALHAVTVYAIIGGIVNIAIDILWCIPVSDNWSLDRAECHIVSSIRETYVGWAFNISVDVARAITMLCSTARFIILQLNAASGNYGPIYERFLDRGQHPVAQAVPSRVEIIQVFVPVQSDPFRPHLENIGDVLGLRSANFSRTVYHA
ncbi:hypothetical protein BP6252_09552 [Coleophoma cylindrospora]|uniref:Rhodopsin domain-containing protein n=1 Tax=Coleophoma cylindrospora TaxID=1849047 RepID=A0A3D8R2E7_9HELO|nr:hypothetical protein BP6252_09552 [Coleophoma cylindrospora]